MVFANAAVSAAQKPRQPKEPSVPRVGHSYLSVSFSGSSVTLHFCLL
jgi:hypothetical protein